MNLFSPIEKISNRQAAKVLDVLLSAVSVDVNRDEFVSNTCSKMCSSKVPYETAKKYMDAIRFTHQNMCHELKKIISELEDE